MFIKNTKQQKKTAGKMAASTSCIGQITVLELPKKDRAMELLREVAVWVEPVMKKHSWFVPLLAERNFGIPNVLGMNTGGGRMIELRLRVLHDEERFFELDRLMDTMLHELSHNVHGNHSAAFYELWETLRKELEANLAKGLKGSGAGFDAKGYRVSSETHNSSSMLEARRKAMQAAEKRLRQSQLFGSGPQKVGGSTDLTRLGEAEAVRIATMKRCSDWCGNKQDGAEEKEDVQEREKRAKVAAGVAAGEVSPPAPVVLAPSLKGWSCDVCTFANEQEVAICEMCGNGLKPGTWRCETCSVVNATLFQCAVCDTRRQL